MVLGSDHHQEEMGEPAFRILANGTIVNGIRNSERDIQDDLIESKTESSGQQPQLV